MAASILKQSVPREEAQAHTPIQMDLAVHAMA